MTVFFCWFAIILLVITAGLQFTRKRTIGCWLLMLFPISLCIGIMLDLARGERALGAASYHTDLKTLAFLSVLVVATLLAALRPRWIWPFWIVWLFNAVCCGIAVYLTFFWHVFS